MIKKLFFITILFIGLKGYAADYYVSTNGSNANNGLSEGKAWRTLSYAVKKVKPGDTVWIKAGNYGKEQVVFTKNGTKKAPISFIGYKKKPGDVKELYYRYAKGKKLEYNELPTFNGGDRTIKYGFKLYSRKYIIIKNLQILNYSYPIDALSGANHLTFENLIVKNAGTAAIGGSAFRLSHNDNHNNVIRSCMAINATQTAYFVNGNYNIIENSKSYADEDNGKVKGGTSMDYHVAISGSNNIVRGHYAEHVGNLTHTGHGIALKASKVKTENNLIENCDLVNINGSIELRHRKVQNNIIRNIRIKGKDSRYSGGIHFRDGASNNTVEKVYIDGLKGQNGAFSFYDTTEDEGTQSAASKNVIKNIQISNCELGFRFGSSSKKVKVHKIYDNIITNCTFYNVKTFMRNYSSAKSTNNKIQNSIIDNSKYHYHKSVAPKGWIEKNNSYINNNFKKLSGNGNNSKSAYYVNAKKNDFSLKPNSECIDAGIKTDLVKDDIKGTERPQGKAIDIGAYEYVENNTGSSQQIKINTQDDLIICKGESVTLTASGGDTFTWSTGEKTAEITVAPTKTTIYSVTNGATEDKVEIIVNELPKLDLGKDKVISLGESVTIKAPSGFSSYKWSTGETTSSITFSPTKSATYSVEVTNANGCPAEDTIVVEVENQVSAGDDQVICKGESVTLKAVGGDTFTWNTGEKTAEITVKPTKTTTYSVTNGVTEDKIKVIVNESPELDLGNDKVISLGESITIEAPAGLSSYKWSTGETTSSITINPTVKTTYSVEVTNANGCSAEDTIIVDVKKGIFVSEDVTICKGESTTLQASGADSYLWGNGETTNSIEVSPDQSNIYSLSTEKNGVTKHYYIVVTVDEGCAIKGKEIVLYPNPTVDKINVKLRGYEKDINISLLGINGNILYQEVIKNNEKVYNSDSELKRQFDLSRYSKGIYFFRLQNGNDIETKKIVLK